MKKHTVNEELALEFRKVILANPALVRKENLKLLAPALGFRTPQLLARWLKASIKEETTNEDSSD